MSSLMNTSDMQIQRAVSHAMSPHAVVIGSGFGGLAAAIRLGAKGYRVTVVEKLDQAGGRARVHRQDGFTFDAGPTIITAPFLLDELWQLCNRNFRDEVELRLMQPFYRIRFDDGTHFDYSGDPEANKREIARFAPGDVEGYGRFMEASAANYHVGFEQLVDRPFSSLVDMLKVLPDMLRLRADRSVHSMVSRYVKDPRIRMVLSFHPLLIGGNPFSASSVYTLISHLERKGGVYSAVGGTGKIIDGMVDLVEEQGNALLYSAEVEEILVRNGAARGVRLTDGNSIDADVVVSTGVPAAIFERSSPRRLSEPMHPSSLSRD